MISVLQHHFGLPPMGEGISNQPARWFPYPPNGYCRSTSAVGRRDFLHDPVGFHRCGLPYARVLPLRSHYPGHFFRLLEREGCRFQVTGNLFPAEPTGPQSPCVCTRCCVPAKCRWSRPPFPSTARFSQRASASALRLLLPATLLNTSRYPADAVVILTRYGVTL